MAYGDKIYRALIIRMSGFLAKYIPLLRELDDMEVALSPLLSLCRKTSPTIKVKSNSSAVH